MANKLINDVRNATSDEVAICFIAWLGQTTGTRGAHVDSNRRRQACHLTAQYVGRFNAANLNGSYNLFDYRDSADIEPVLAAIEATQAYRATQRVNGGNGFFQNAFNKYRQFWRFLENGGEILEPELEHAIRQWTIVQQSLNKNNIP